MSATIHDVLLYLYLTRKIDLPVSFQEWGNLIYNNGRLTPLGGMLAQFEVNHHGIFIRKARVIVPAGCGHIIKTIDDIAGFCGVCRRVICSKEGCLDICEESGITVCRKDRVKTRDGRIVSIPEARKLTSILKSLKKRKHKEITDEQETGRKLLR